MGKDSVFFGKNFVRNFLAISWSYFSFAYFIMFLIYPIPKENQNAVHIILGFVIGIPVLAFYFSSTQGSQEKDSYLANSQPIPSNSTTNAVTVSETTNKENSSPVDKTNT